MILHALFFASGALGLVYEVLWMRRFSIILGAAAPATAATLAAVFTGWGIGSLALGARCARWRRPLRAFGWIEIGVGTGSLLFEPILRLTSPLRSPLPLSLGDHPSIGIGIDVVVAVLAALPATFLMGGSLPVLAEAIASDRGRLGIRAGGLYAANTLGAAAGALAVPAALLPGLGASLTGLSAAAGSAIVGILAWILDASRVPSRATTPAAGSGAPRRPARILLLLAFLSGLLTLAFEALAVRMLSQVHENSIHAFAVVLAVFLIALAGGAAGARAILRRGSRTSRLLGIAWMGAGVCLAIVPRLFFRITGGMSFIPGESGGRLLGIAVICIGPAAILCGAVLPLLMEMAGGEPGRHAGPALGRLLGANTAGAIAGPLLATFVLQPRLGLWWSLTAIGLTSAVAGEWALRDPRGGRIASLVRLAAIGSVVLMLRPGDVPRVGIVAGEKLLGMSEGSFGTVAVIEREGQRRIKLDNAYLIGGTASTGEERLQAHLPLLLHPAPRKVAFLGMGTGISAGAALLHPVEEVTVIEIVPEIIDAARVDFSEANLGIASDPRVHVILDDARHWLAGSRGSFDVIVGDLFVPWRRGESSLLTREQFESARRALAPGGIFCQWVPLYQMSREEFRIVLNTFLDVFPETTLWHGDMNAAEPAIGLIARAGGAPIDPASADARGRELARRLDPANPYLSDPAGLWLHLIGPIDRVDPWIAGARINRDDRPWIEMGTVEPGATDSSARGAVVGRSATALLDRLGGGPGAGSLETILGIERLRWRAAGRKLWEASILGREGRGRDADATGLEALASLPAALQLGVLGKVLCAADCPDPLATK